MTDKVLCPWCGAEMESEAAYHPGLNGENLWNAWTSCKNDACCADGPIVSEIGSKQEALEAARTAALRRYEPPIRPMTKEDLEAVYDAREDHEWPYEAMPPYLFLESHIEKDGYCWILWCGACDLWEIGHRKYTRDTYGKTWRCWPRKPTEAERKEAKWDD